MCNPERCKAMVLEVQADLARESEREAKGCDWDVYQKECDRNEGLEYEVEELKAKVAELESGYIIDPSKDDIRLSGVLNKIKADAIREAVKAALVSKNHPYHWSVIRDDMNDYADKLEASTL